MHGHSERARAERRIYDNPRHEAHSTRILVLHAMVRVLLLSISKAIIGTAAAFLVPRKPFGGSQISREGGVRSQEFASLFSARGGIQNERERDTADGSPVFPAIAGSCSQGCATVGALLLVVVNQMKPAHALPVASACPDPRPKPTKGPGSPGG